MEDYKDGIRESRKGSLGGSDGNVLAQVASLGYVPKSAYKRIAIMKGLIEREDISTLAMRYGDFIEQSIYEHLKSVDDRYQSNPLWISGRYSKDGVRLICHPDFVLFDEEKKVLRVYECKATKYNHNATRSAYQNQLYIEYTIAEEIVKAKGEGWKVEIYLCHYDTSNDDLEDGFVFNADNLHIYRLRIQRNLYDIDKAMTIINEFSANMDFYAGVLLALRVSMQSMGQKTAPVISGFIELLMKLIAAVWLIPRFGFVGTCVTEPVTWVLMAAFLLVIYLTKTRKLFTEEEGIQQA